MMRESRFKRKPLTSLVLLAAVLAFFLSLQCFFLYKDYRQEKEALVKNVDESLQHAIVSYKTFAHNKDRLEVLLPFAQTNSDSSLVQELSENLVWNPDFTAKQVMYSNYPLLPENTQTLIPNTNGWYFITDSPEKHFPQWKGKGWGGNGNFLLIDGSMLSGQIAWNQKISVEPNTFYCLRFSVSTVSLSKNAGADEYWQRAFVSASINDSSIACILAPDQLNTWNTCQAIWYSGKDSIASIDILDLNSGSNYNDMGLDHILFFKTNRQSLLQRSPVPPKKNDSIDIKAIQTLFKDEIDVYGLPVGYQLTFSSPGKPARISESHMSTGIYAVNPVLSVRCEIRHYMAYLLSDLLASIILVFVSLCFSIVLLRLIYRNILRREQVNALKYEITNNITHGLKTPVSTILAAVDMLRKYQLSGNSEKITQYLEITHLQAHKLNELIDKAMEVALLEDTDFTLQPEKVNLKTLVEEVVKSEQLRIKSHPGIDLSFIGNSFLVKGDAFHISNVLQALLDNSIRYCSQPPHIRIRLKEEKNSVHITITDNGVGISKQYHEAVFERYFRIPDSDRYNQKGHGLGLNYVQTIMRLHKGNVTLESDGRTGTQISLLFKK